MQASFRAASKVASVTLGFWILKVLSTGMGETGADYLDHKYPPILVVMVSGVVLAASLIWQLRAKEFSSLKYWTAVVMVSVFGTLAADAVHVLLGVPYWSSTAFFTAGLMLVFFVWRRLEGALEMSSILTTRAELLYWTTVMVTFALGTAAGDWLAMGLRLGFLGGTLIFTIGFVVPIWLGRSKRVNPTVAFWIAYTFTRPMGASFADWLALPQQRGGIGFGTLTVTLIWTGAIVLVALASGVRRRTSGR